LNRIVAQSFQHTAALYGREIEWFEKPKVLRYGPGNYYGVHADNCYRARTDNFWTKKIDRDISLLIYLNEDFEGGSLSFEKFFYSFQPRVGDLVLFPSDNRYKHCANPVRSGTRYAVVSWGAFLGEPRVHATPIAKHVLMSGF
jgi:predicted 2-oxoglutarate/Fe(II)-dependent dioxygenase YbiX